MASPNILSELSNTLSSGSRILSDQKSPDFVSSLQRWSDYGLQVPSAIIQPASEQDIVLTVQTLLKASIPFVLATGGNSRYSTIDQHGVVLDLGRYKGVDVDAAKNLATVKGGTLMKELQLALHPHKQLAAVGNANTLGVIPYYIGGGTTHYKPFVGFAAENIIAAKLITAKGELVEVSEAQHPELLWGVRGAGQFLGLVTELTIRTYPYSRLGNDQGQRMCGTYVFLPHQADAVGAALQPILESKEYITAGHVVVGMAPPDMKHQVLMVAPEVFASADEATKLLQPLSDLGPIMQALQPSTFDKHSDHLDYLCAKGDFKRVTQIGLAGWTTENLTDLIKLHSELVSTCPDAVMSAFSFQWNTPSKIERSGNTSFGLEDVDYWLNLTSWYKNEANHGTVEDITNRAQAAVRSGVDEQDYISYTNIGREDPITYRYKGVDRLEKLKALKKQWDPAGIFTTEFL
ncbi:hypothetical protein VSDG_02063 [Cytospora chrysosperma]|uniref:FAD-binding PCMH-type domain-containing protein n=1 Tax=Cytospora chrysosperma TaxID=252740 RepID=A0A423WDL0_CYTCH|nr:hypothetical protein VSDG_02063 [Valsa sordida]